METSPSISARIAQAFKWLGPNRAVVAEDESKPETGELVSRSGESFVIPGSWLKAIAQNEDKILARAGGAGVGAYDELLDDDVAFSNFQQRRLAVISREWEVAPGDEEDPRSVEAADHLRDQLKRLSWDRITSNMLFGIWHGYAVAEMLYELGPDGKYRLADIVVPDRKWFGFTNEGELKFRPGYSVTGEALPPNKFWVLRTGASHDFAFYGLGLAHWCYWPIWFKRNVIKFWALYLEKLGYPTVVGEQNDSWTDTEKGSFMTALVAIGRDRAVKVPAGALEGIKLLEAQRSASGTSGYLEFVTEQNEALMRVILGQPGTSKATPQGVGGKQAEVHEDVKAEIVKADSDLVCESFNATAPRWLTRWNFGEDVAPPRVYRILDEPEDVDSIAERDERLDGLGWQRTDESFEEVYGTGYERKPEPDPPAMLPGLGAPGAVRVPANDEDEDRRAAFAARDVAPLYVYRKLLNAGALRTWARSQGIPNLEPAAELHVTVLFSKTPVDWFALSDGFGFDDKLVVPEGGPRKVDRLGDAIVLRFASDPLQWSHRRKVELGGSHDFPEYLPHVTIGRDPDGTFDLEAVEPYVGELRFGPEMFEDIELDPAFAAVTFTAAEEDAIARLARDLADETNPALLEFGTALKEALAGVKSPEAARVALLTAFEQLPAERMAAAVGLPLVLERMAGEAGLEP
jgi:hypothetical protein